MCKKASCHLRQKKSWSFSLIWNSISAWEKNWNQFPKYSWPYSFLFWERWILTQLKNIKIIVSFAYRREKYAFLLLLNTIHENKIISLIERKQADEPLHTHNFSVKSTIITKVYWLLWNCYFINSISASRSITTWSNLLSINNISFELSLLFWFGLSAEIFMGLCMTNCFHRWICRECWCQCYGLPISIVRVIKGKYICLFNYTFCNLL